MHRITFRILPLLALAAPIHANATVYMTVEQAQAAMFPHAALQPAGTELTPAQIAQIKKVSGEAPLGTKLKAWRAADGGWLIVDEVLGKHEYITYAVALDSAGAVRTVEILDYREAYGGQVRDAKWCQQFVGKHAGMSLKLGSDIKNISGATLSSKHVTDGVRRVLATYAVVLAHA